MLKEAEYVVEGITLVGIRRVVVKVVARRPVAVEIEELPVPATSSLSALRKLAHLRASLSSASHSLDLSPKLSVERKLSPEEQVATYALGLDPDASSRQALLDSLDWVESLPLLQALADRRGYKVNRKARELLEDVDTKVKKAKLPKNVQEAIDRVDDINIYGAKDLRRTLTDICWVAPPAPAIDPAKARELLDTSHSGMETVKQAVLDYLSLLEWKRRQGQQGGGSNLCLVGPPGVGKTSIASTIAEATGRRLEIINLGGASDVYMGGSDRTFRGAQPGEVVRRLRAGKAHPSQVVFLLDELDKVPMWSDHPALPALLALLDPSQNGAWQDQFLDNISLDLSGAIFLSTANNWEAIAAPLRDRLRRIQLPGYTVQEQLAIAHSHLLPKLKSQLGLNGEVQIEDGAMESLVRDHPYADGVRQIEQRLQTVAARALREHLESGTPVVVTAELAKLWVPAESGKQEMGFRL
jgi:ATP-dependent Lon protease